MDYRLHHPGIPAYDRRMDLHLSYDRMRMQHRMYHQHHAPPALYPQFHHAPPEPMPQFENRQQHEASRETEVMSSQTVEGKKRLIIFPRRKAGQRERDINNVAPVHLTLETIEEIADVPLLVAAKQLGISKTALKNACRHLGLERWPFRRRMQNARLQSKAAEKAASQMREAAAAAASEARSGQARQRVGQKVPQGKSVKEEEWSDESESWEEQSGSTSHRRSSPPLSLPSQRPSSASPLQPEDDRLGGIYSALTTPQSTSSASTSDDQAASPTNLRTPLRRHPAARAPPIAAPRLAPVNPRARPARKAAPLSAPPRAPAPASAAAAQVAEEDTDWIDARVRGVSPARVSPALEEKLSVFAEESLHMPPQFRLRIPPAEDPALSQTTLAAHLERGMAQGKEMVVKELERAGLSQAEMSWVMEEEHSMWGEVDSYALPAMYQPIGGV